MKVHSVEIDKNSGFCGGVIRAIGSAEKALASKDRIYSLGDIVHNEEELARLQKNGLVSIGKDELQTLPEGETLLIRAHGEPPQTYKIIEERGLNLIDCTCPVVLKIQKSIREAYSRISQQGGSIVIFGKIGHAEVLGLVGQVAGDAFVVEDCAQLEALLDNGKIDTAKPVEVFSQTTKSPIGYTLICELLKSRMESESLLTIHDTICKQVANRHQQLEAFAKDHDVIVFVAGKSSSNGKVLCEVCRSANPRTYLIGAPEEIDSAWFSPTDKVGICGATSTPKWLLESVKFAIINTNN